MVGGGREGKKMGRSWREGVGKKLTQGRKLGEKVPFRFKTRIADA